MFKSNTFKPYQIYNGLYQDKYEDNVESYSNTSYDTISTFSSSFSSTSNTDTDVGTDTDIDNKYSDEFVLIGITGRKRSGKDTIGNYLVDNYGFVRIAYADSLKEACKIIFGFTDEQVYGDELKEIIDEYWQHTPREIMQKVGTELFRIALPHLCENISDDIWIKSVERKIRLLLSQGHTRFVITDNRFQNELDFIKRLGGQTWKVTRQSILRDIDPLKPVHRSEALIDDFVCDTYIPNDESIEQLNIKVRNNMYELDINTITFHSSNSE